jgi:hypothetical protein
LFQGIGPVRASIFAGQSESAVEVELSQSITKSLKGRFSPPPRGDIKVRTFISWNKKQYKCSNVEVTVRDFWGNILERGRTNGDGRVTFKSRMGLYRIVSQPHPNFHCTSIRWLWNNSIDIDTDLLWHQDTIGYINAFAFLKDVLIPVLLSNNPALAALVIVKENVKPSPLIQPLSAKSKSS